MNSGRTDRICRGSPAISPTPTAPYFGSWPSTVAATGLAATRWLAATVVTAKGAISAWNPGTPTAAQSRAGWYAKLTRPARMSLVSRASLTGNVEL